MSLSEPNALRERMWSALVKTRFVFLISKPGAHAQPMTAFAEPAAARLWFFTGADTDLVRELGSDRSQITFVDEEQKLWASLLGTLRRNDDREVIDRYWNPMVAAWYPKGKSDPALALLAFDATEADIWTSAGAVRFGWEIAKANLTGTLPDVGARAHVGEAHP